MGDTIDQKIKENKETEESKRIELNSNIRSMGSVSLPELHGHRDFLRWKKAQECLNTHTDPYKKAKKLFDNAQSMLKRIVDGKLLKAKAVVGFWKAHAENEDVVLQDEANNKVATLNFLRQQSEREAGKPHMSLAD